MIDVPFFEIPLERPENTGEFQQTTDLGGTDFLLRFDWVARWGEDIGAWRMTVSTIGGRVISEGRVLVAGSLLLTRVVDDDRPAGDLAVVADGRDPPGLDDLGDTARLYYVDGQELQDIIANRRGG